MNQTPNNESEPGALETPGLAEGNPSRGHVERLTDGHRNIPPPSPGRTRALGVTPAEAFQAASSCPEYRPVAEAMERLETAEDVADVSRDMIRAASRR